MALRAALLLLVAALAVHGAAAADGDGLQTRRLCPPTDASCTAGSIVLAAYPKKANVVYVYATIGLPSVAVAAFEKPVDLKSVSANWTAIENNDFSHALDFDGQTTSYISSLALASIIEFADSGGAIVKPTNFVRRQQLPAKNWLPANVSQLASSGVCRFQYKEGNFSVVLKLRPFDTEGRLSLNPHTTYTVNSSSIDVSVANFSFGVQDEALGAKPVHYRLALEIFFYKRMEQTATVSNTKYIDDEYSPSIFRRTAILFKGKGDAPKSAYVAYKPVVFGSTGRAYTNMTELHTSALQTLDVGRTPRANESVAFAMAGAPSAIVGVNVSFGTDGDGWFSPPMVAWSSVAGLGEPNTDSMSTALLITLIASLGLPGLTFVGGGVYLGVKKCRAPRSGFQPIN